jgi:predicted AAA+ superfamily ATPase
MQYEVRNFMLHEIGGTISSVLVRRQLEGVARRLFSSYPVLTLTGPRQSGKTTLCRNTFPDLAYANLEAPDRRDFAIQDPRGFLRTLGEPAIIDEIQWAPELVSYVQEYVDEVGGSGKFVLTGSQQLRVSEAVSQSLAGRTGILRLLPFSIEEALQLRGDLDNEALIYTRSISSARSRTSSWVSRSKPAPPSRATISKASSDSPRRCPAAWPAR